MKFFTFVLLFYSTISCAGTYPISDHYDGKKFFNPHKHEMKSWWQVIKWKLTADRKVWPEEVPNKNYQLPPLSKNNGVLTFINHATFLLQLENLNVLTDPVYSERTSPVKFAGPKRVRKPGIPFESLPPIDVVVISHNHYDHMDMETLKRLDGKFHPLFLVPLGDEKRLKEAGLQNVQELDWWQEVKVKGSTIIFTPAQHWSARTPFDKCESLWGGYYIQQPRAKIFFAGDTGYSPHFLDVKTRLGAPDVALLPIGAYEPRWFMEFAHMNPEEAVKAHIDLAPMVSLGMHFGTFQLTDEGYGEPVEHLQDARKKHDIPDAKFLVLDQGQSYFF